MNETARASSLQRALAAFTPVDQQQEQALRQMRHLLSEAEGDPFHRSRVDPGHFTASGLVLADDDQSLLLIFHRKLERWLQPGGHFESGDLDHIAAARREVKEEVGLDELEIVSSLYDLDVHTIPANAREGEHLHFDLRVLFRSRQTGVQASDEVLDARSWRLTELARGGESVIGSDESVARVAARLLTRVR